MSLFAPKAAIVAVVPLDAAARMLRRGWKDTGRGNSITRTLIREFPTENGAREFGCTLDCVYWIQGAA